MPWQCSICGEFTADKRERLVNHIGRCHRNEPNFHIVCGLDGCTASFKKYFSWRKHLTRHHAEQPSEPIEPEANEDALNQEHNGHINRDALFNTDNTRSAALYVLKIQEECSLPRSTVEKIITNTTDMVRQAISTVEMQVENCLRESNVDQQTIQRLKAIFGEDNVASNPFHNLATTTQQLTYFKTEFKLKVSCWNTYFSGNALNFRSGVWLSSAAWSKFILHQFLLSTLCCI